MPLPAGTPQLLGVWGASASDVFAVGDMGTIIHYDGQSWTKMASNTSATIRDVWGTSGSNVYAVDQAWQIHHYDGSTWSSVNSWATNQWLLGVWGTRRHLRRRDGGDHPALRRHKLDADDPRRRPRRRRRGRSRGILHLGP